jgi:hypothetical protein
MPPDTNGIRLHPDAVYLPRKHTQEKEIVSENSVYFRVLPWQIDVLYIDDAA